MKSYPFTTARYGYPLILGLGETGLAAANWFLSQQMAVRIADTRVNYLTQTEALKAQYPTQNIETVLGSDALASSVLDGVKTVVLSPGLAITDEAVAALLTLAKQQEIQVISEVELFAQALLDLQQVDYQPKVLAVTGTNGKTTVTQMLKHMIAESGFSVTAAGNISPATIGALQQAVITQQLPDYWVIELSSFQLVHTWQLPVQVGAVLNLSQDHLDWHGSMAAYAEAKTHLLAMSEIAVVNADDLQTVQLATGHKHLRHFGLIAPTQSGDVGVIPYQGQDWICTVSPTGEREYLLPTAALVVVGKHNLSNAVAALVMAKAVGLEWAPLLEVLRTYHGEPHRCQLVRIVREVTFINDSKGTNVGATVAAIEGITQPLVLILGGLAKGQDFTPLATALLQSQCHTVILIGQDAPFIAQALAETHLPLVFAPSMQSAVEQAFAAAQPNGAVLLSPACASMDMFASYVARGDCFIDVVTELALDLGEMA